MKKYSEQISVTNLFNKTSPYITVFYTDWSTFCVFISLYLNTPFHIHFVSTPEHRRKLPLNQTQAVNQNQDWCFLHWGPIISGLWPLSWTVPWALIILAGSLFFCHLSTFCCFPWVINCSFWAVLKKRQLSQI